MVEILPPELADADDPHRREENRARVESGFWPKLKASLARLPFAEELVAAYLCAFDRRTPLRVRGILLAALGYFVLPVDTIPDVFLGLGFTDDAAVIAAALAVVRSAVTQEHRAEARAILARLKAETLAWR